MKIYRRAKIEKGWNILIFIIEFSAIETGNTGDEEGCIFIKIQCSIIS